MTGKLLTLGKSELTSQVPERFGTFRRFGLPNLAEFVAASPIVANSTRVDYFYPRPREITSRLRDQEKDEDILFWTSSPIIPTTPRNTLWRKAFLSHDYVSTTPRLIRKSPSPRIVLKHTTRIQTLKIVIAKCVAMHSSIEYSAPDPVIFSDVTFSGTIFSSCRVAAKNYIPEAGFIKLSQDVTLA